MRGARTALSRHHIIFLDLNIGPAFNNLTTSGEDFDNYLEMHFDKDEAWFEKTGEL